MTIETNILRTLLVSGVTEAFSVFSSKNNGESLSDIYLKLDEDSGKLEFFDDMENFLVAAPQAVWEKDHQGNEHNYKNFVKQAKLVLSEMVKDGFFEVDFLFKPFSISLVDEEFIVQEELLFLDDENYKIDSSLLENLDQELDDFLSHLMEDN